MRDPLDLLTPPTAGPDPEQRWRALEASLGVLRRRRHQRRERTIAALAVVAAVALVLFAVLPPAPQTSRFLPRPDEAGAEKVPSASEAEWGALDRPDEAKALYRQAGERYAAQGDFAGAVRSYGGALDAGTADDLEPAAEDDWLLMAIKIARKKESER